MDNPARVAAPGSLAGDYGYRDPMAAEPAKEERPLRPGQRVIMDLPALVQQLHTLQASGRDALIIRGRVIAIDFVHPPIPLRSCDYQATEYGYDQGDPVGHGATRFEAIDDLFEQIAEREAP
jgi:hypothetical protein